MKQFYFPLTKDWENSGWFRYILPRMQSLFRYRQLTSCSKRYRLNHALCRQADKCQSSDWTKWKPGERISAAADHVKSHLLFQFLRTLITGFFVVVKTWTACVDWTPWNRKISSSLSHLGPGRHVFPFPMNGFSLESSTASDNTRYTASSDNVR